MDWLILLTAAAFEIAWAIGLKSTEGFTRLWPSVLTITAMAISMFLLAWAVRTIPIGTGYAVWTGIGAVGAAAWGIVVLKEPATALRLICLGLIIFGVAGLKLSSTQPEVTGAESETHNGG